MIQTIQGSEFDPEGVLAELLSTFTCIVFIKRRDKKIFFPSIIRIQNGYRVGWEGTLSEKYAPTQIILGVILHDKASTETREKNLAKDDHEKIQRSVLWGRQQLEIRRNSSKTSAGRSFIECCTPSSKIEKLRNKKNLTE